MTNYISSPGKELKGGVLVLHAWWGLNDFFIGFCDRMARIGFLALAPDLYNGEVARTIVWHTHPQHPHMIYLFDYGYEGTFGSDGGGTDVLIGSDSDRSLTRILCTFDTIKRDAVIKLLLGFMESDVQVIRAFLGDMRTLYIPALRRKIELP